MNDQEDTSSDDETPREFGKLWPLLRLSFLATIGLTVAYAITDAYSFFTYHRVTNSADELSAAAENLIFRADMIQLAVTLPLMLALFTAVFAYCRFHYRAMRNLQVIDAADLRTTPFWAVGYYFVPIVALWKPLGAVRQVWRASHNPETADVPVPAFIGWWWFFWLVSNFLDSISTRFAFKTVYDDYGMPIDIDIYLASLMFSLLAAPFTVVSAMLVIRFSKQIMLTQQQHIIGCERVASEESTA